VIRSRFGITGRRLAALLVTVFLAAGCGGEGSGTDGGDGAAGESRSATFDLYFPGEGGRLYVEERDLEVTGDPRDRARAIVLALLEGPRNRVHFRPFPEEVGLVELYFDPRGTVYVDLGAEGQETPPASGSMEEMARVYSVVDSVALNVPEARRVVILWNGVQRESFAGHLDTSVPLEPEISILSQGAQARRRGEAR
jgi:hypothetical protein